MKNFRSLTGLLSPEKRAWIEFLGYIYLELSLLLRYCLVDVLKTPSVVGDKKKNLVKNILVKYSLFSVET